MANNTATENTCSITLPVDSTEGVSAASRVFGTYELLESIILALPGEDILVAAYVHKDWKDLITSSIAIEKVLASTPFFLQEQDQNKQIKPRSKDSPLLHSKITHLLLEGCDIVIHRVGAFEAIALLNPTTLAQGQRCLISFLTREERIPRLTSQDRKQLSQGWTRPFADRFQPGCDYHDMALLNQLNLGLLQRLGTNTPSALEYRGLQLEHPFTHVERFSYRVQSWVSEDKLTEAESDRAIWSYVIMDNEFN